MSSTPIRGQLVPTRSIFVTQSQMSAWPRRQRIVYALVDGKNTVQRIAEILSLSLFVVEQVLRDLQMIHVVSLGQEDIQQPF
jgi:hypothetical protein